MTYSCAFIGTGPDPETPVSGESFAMAYRHAAGYERLENCELIACADLVPEHAAAFAERHDIPDERVYEDYETMLAEAAPDVVSVCTPVPTHAPIVLDCVRSGVLEAVHCEKPMADTWGDARLMAQEATRHGVQLTFNHQRRLAPPFRNAADLLDEGAIGDLERIEVSCAELLDTGTHFIDIANMYAGEAQPAWVLGGIDYRTEHVKYGAHNENHAIVQWAYENGIQAVATTGHGQELIPATIRLLGSEGRIELRPRRAEDVSLRDHAVDEGGWTTVEPTETAASAVEIAIEHVVESLAAGVEPDLSARRALSTTEAIFATYESVRRRGRVDLPLTIDDNPLVAMVERGELTPDPPANS